MTPKAPCTLEAVDMTTNTKTPISSTEKIPEANMSNVDTQLKTVLHKLFYIKSQQQPVQGGHGKM